MRTSLKDIAAALGLSMTTVSWVLAGKGDERNISKATQKRILECATLMDYQPNLIARSLHTGVSHTLGLVMPSIRDRFYARIAETIELEAARAGYTLMVCNTHGVLDDESRILSTLRARQVDGILMAPSHGTSPELCRLAAEEFPFVLFDSTLQDVSANYVIVDNETAACRLVSHLLDSDCRKIALFLTNPDLFTSIQREQGYLRAHAEKSVPVDPSLKVCVEFAHYEAQVREQLVPLLQRPDVDGFFFMSHILAEIAVLEMRARGVDLNRYRMACLHEEDALCVLNPRMNTAYMPVEQIGSESVNILLNILKRRQEGSAEEEQQRTVLSTEIHLRD